MRVIAGNSKGRRLATPRNRAIRPTADRLRESIFNIIAAEVAGAVVLDLFAGSGAMAIEAVSRGAARALCLDHCADAVRLIQRNIALCGYSQRIHVRRWDIVRNLHLLNTGPPSYDLVFMDPPYRQNLVVPALQSLLRSNCLTPKALIVIEHDHAEPIDVTRFENIILDSRRVYGGSLLSLFTVRSSLAGNKT